MSAASITTEHPEPRAIPTLREIQRLNAEFETAEPQDILRWAIATYSQRIVALSSFGASSAAILHMISEIDQDVPVAFLQTGYHFAETLKLRDEVADRFGLLVENWESRGGRPAFLSKYPSNLHSVGRLDGLEVPPEAEDKVQTGTDLCCWMNKVEPLQRALRKRLAYITSLRRDGGSEVRARTQILEYYEPPHRAEPLVKVNALANWDKRALWGYIYRNQLPINDLWLQGYKSIGCRPCTQPVEGEGDERSGRWSGTVKKECGIHTADQPLNYEI
ncbi:phosphoadenylyl-sulfate reductase [Candidatus Poribacteria bacterium]|nr:phosphoadenylyl-sulfate reductase [Candidatus Poribacteria bacterium]